MMEAIFSSMRWPPVLYRAIKARAAEEGVSVNEFVRDRMAESLNITLEAPSAKKRSREA